LIARRLGGVFMSHRVAKIYMCFQGSPFVVGDSVQHGCNMAGAAGPRKSMFMRLSLERGSPQRTVHRSRMVARLNRSHSRRNEPASYNWRRSLASSQFREGWGSNCKAKHPIPKIQGSLRQQGRGRLQRPSCHWVGSQSRCSSLSQVPCSRPSRKRPESFA